MKIAVWHNLPSGGGKRALFYHVKGLVKRGHTVESWCPPTADQKYLPLSSLIHENILELKGIGGKWAKPFQKAKQALDFVRRIQALDDHCRICAEQINNGGFDLMFANTSLYISAPPIGKYINIPKVLYLQEPYRLLYESYPKLPWIALATPKNALALPSYIIQRIMDAIIVRRRRIQMREELLNAKSFDRILTNSIYSRESILRAYGLRARVCYLGLDTELFMPSNKKKDNVIVSLGAVDYQKDTKFLIESMSLVRKPRPKLVLIANITGKRYLQEVIELAQRKEVEIELKQNISDAELVDILSTALMLVYAPRLEPFGYAPLEANACGTPVVAVAEAGVRETVFNFVNGIIVEPVPYSMAQGIERLIMDRDLSEKLGRQGRTLISKKWSLNSATDNLEKYLNETCSQKQVP